MAGSRNITTILSLDLPFIFYGGCAFADTAPLKKTNEFNIKETQTLKKQKTSEEKTMNTND